MKYDINNANLKIGGITKDTALSIKIVLKDTYEIGDTEQIFWIKYLNVGEDVIFKDELVVSNATISGLGDVYANPMLLVNYIVLQVGVTLK